MIKLFRAARVFLPIFLLSGCAYLNSFNSDLDKQVDSWMAQQEYGKVLDTLRYVRPANPKYQLLRKKRQQALAEAKRFEQAQISKSLNQIEKGQWHEAELTLNDAMKKLPDSEALQHTYQEFTKQRAQYLKSLNTQLAINKAELLIKDKPVQQQLSRTLPDDRKTRQVMDKYRDDSQQVTAQLLTCGADASQINDLVLAEQCYRLADRLQPNTSTRDALTAVQEKLARIQAQALERDLEHRQAQSQARKPPSISQLGHNLLEKSRKALQAGHLKLALSQYDKIPGTDKNQPVVKQYGEEMNRTIRDNVNQGIELGRKLYSQGQVEQALAVWNKLRDLDPDNENLLSHIERAERVLDKIKQLRKEQNSETTTPPANGK